MKKEVESMKSLMRLDPFRTLRRWDPFSDLRTMQREMDRLFDRFLGGETMTIEHQLWAPAVDSYIKDGQLVFKAELPGVDPKDLDVSVNERVLIIKGERKAEKEERNRDYTCREISYGAFERRFELPEGAKIDDLKAKYTNGVLEISMPVPAVSKAKKIEVEMGKEVKHLEGEVKKAA
jgi:HSP20 family protein